MSAAHTAGDVLQAVAPAAELGIVVLLLSRRLWRGFPAFTAYAALHVIKLPAELFLQHQGAAYYKALFITYWSTEGLSAVLTFTVLYELCSHLLHRYDALASAGKLAMNTVAALLLLVSVVSIALAPGSDLSKLVQGMLSLKQTVDVMRLGLVLFLFAFARYFRITIPSHVFGIAVGFAFYASCELAAQALPYYRGLAAADIHGLAAGAAYDCTVLIWMAYLLKRSAASDRAFDGPFHDLGAWNDALAGMLNGR